MAPHFRSTVSNDLNLLQLLPFQHLHWNANCCVCSRKWPCFLAEKISTCAWISIQSTRHSLFSNNILLNRLFLILPSCIALKPSMFSYKRKNIFCFKFLFCLFFTFCSQNQWNMLDSTCCPLGIQNFFTMLSRRSAADQE